jgi:hypothetical protein
MSPSRTTARAPGSSYGSLSTILALTGRRSGSRHASTGKTRSPNGVSERFARDSRPVPRTTLEQRIRIGNDPDQPYEHHHDGDHVGLGHKLAASPGVDKFSQGSTAPAQRGYRDNSSRGHNEGRPDSGQPGNSRLGCFPRVRRAWSTSAGRTSAHGSSAGNIWSRSGLVRSSSPRTISVRSSWLRTISGRSSWVRTGSVRSCVLRISSLERGSVSVSSVRHRLALTGLVGYCLNRSGPVGSLFVRGDCARNIPSLRFGHAFTRAAFRCQRGGNHPRGEAE